jgi:hypothetical protein
MLYVQKKSHWESIYLNVSNTRGRQAWVARTKSLRWIIDGEFSRIMSEINTLTLPLLSGFASSLCIPDFDVGSAFTINNGTRWNVKLRAKLNPHAFLARERVEFQKNFVHSACWKCSKQFKLKWPLFLSEKFYFLNLSQSQLFPFGTQVVSPIWCWWIVTLSSPHFLRSSVLIMDV